VKFIWIGIVAGMLSICLLNTIHADMVWVTPVGTIGLPLQATEALIGFDAILKQSIGGASVPIWTDPKGIVSLQLGAVAAWPNREATFEPYIALSHNILREITTLPQFKNLEINVFGRYASEQGKAGLGVAFSYAFATGS
jgi:hypothetical protein